MRTITNINSAFCDIFLLTGFTFILFGILVKYTERWGGGGGGGGGRGGGGGGGGCGSCAEW